MSHSLKRYLLTIAALSALLFASAAWADNHARIVRLSYIKGEVQVERGQGSEKALLNMPVIEGMKITTGSDGAAELEFEDGSTVRLTPDSLLNVQRLASSDDGGQLTTIALDRGTAYVNYKKQKDDDFRLVLPNHDLALDHSVRLRAEVATVDAEVAVFSGELDVQGAEREVRVKKNESITLDLNDAAHYTLANNLESAPYDDWNKDREKYRERYAKSFDNSNQYGLADLAYYGNSFYVPGYGMMWQPYDAYSPNWNPFNTGFWAYYPAGWTWISPYPWGWLPYRYGGWTWVNGYGWMWGPSLGSGFIGPRNWVPCTTVVNAPRGFVPPRPPAVTTPAPGAVIAVGHPTPLPTQQVGHNIDHDGRPGRNPRLGPEFEDGLRRHAPRDVGASSATAAAGSTTAPANSLAQRPAAVPGSVRDLRNNIDTPMNRSMIREMEQRDTYRRSPREVYGPAVMGAARADMERRTYSPGAGAWHPSAAPAASASAGGHAAAPAPQHSAPPPSAPAPHMSAPAMHAPSMGGAHAGSEGRGRPNPK